MMIKQFQFNLRLSFVAIIALFSQFHKVVFKAIKAANKTTKSACKATKVDA